MDLVTETSSYREVPLPDLGRIQVKTIPDLGGRKLQRIRRRKEELERSLKRLQFACVLSLAATAIIFVIEWRLRTVGSAYARSHVANLSFLIGLIASGAVAYVCRRRHEAIAKSGADVTELHARHGYGSPERQLEETREAYAWNRLADEHEALLTRTSGFGAREMRLVARRERLRLLELKDARLKSIAKLQELYRIRRGVDWIHAPGD